MAIKTPDDWETRAACFTLPTEWWFPEGSVSLTTGTAAQALAACQRCPVIQQCAQRVLDLRKTQYPVQHGIWAGIRFVDTHSSKDRTKSRKEVHDALTELAKNGPTKPKTGPHRTAKNLHANALPKQRLTQLPLTAP